MSVSILVVEDKDRTRKHVLDVLAPLNFHIVTAKDGLDGLSKAKTESFDMILTDHKMPVMDGLSLLKNLRELESYRDAPIFFMTTQDLTEVEPKALKAGATACFSKPLQAEPVREQIKTHIQRSVA